MCPKCLPKICKPREIIQNKIIQSASSLVQARRCGTNVVDRWRNNADVREGRYERGMRESERVRPIVFVFCFVITAQTPL